MNMIEKLETQTGNTTFQKDQHHLFDDGYSNTHLDVLREILARHILVKTEEHSLNKMREYHRSYVFTEQENETQISNPMHGVGDKINAFFVSRKPDPTTGYYRKTQKWIGTITDIDKDSFSAKLDDVSDPGTYEIAEFEFDDVSPDDRELINIGQVFYWSVGYFVSRDGQVKKDSFIRFQRLPVWTESDLDLAADRATELNNSIAWD